MVFPFVFCCSLFSDTTDNSDYTASDDWSYEPNKKLGKRVRERFYPNSSCCLDMYLDGVSKLLNFLTKIVGVSA